MLSIDVGYGNVKIYDGEKLAAFPSVFLPCREGFVASTDPNDMQIEIDGERFHVGMTALNRGGESSMVPEDMLRQKIFILSAICSVTKGSFEDKVLLGLPIGDMPNIMKELKKFKGEYDVKFNDHKLHIHITEVKVYPQSESVFKTILAADSNVLEETVGIIDVGQKTVDAALYSFGTYDPAKSGSLNDLGCRSAYVEIARAVNNKLGFDIPYYQARRYLKRVPEDADAAFADMSRKILYRLGNIQWNFKQLDRIVVIGGGAQYLVDNMGMEDKVQVVEDPAFANVISYYKGEEK